MSEPTSMEEYTQRFHSNEKVTGQGIMDTTMHMPCPFCGAPDWHVFAVIDAQEEMQEPHTCSECKRTALSILTVSEDGMSKTFEMVQSGGPPPAKWLPTMRRVDLDLDGDHKLDVPRK